MFSPPAGLSQQKFIVCPSPLIIILEKDRSEISEGSSSLYLNFELRIKIFLNKENLSAVLE